MSVEELKRTSRPRTIPHDTTNEMPRRIRKARCMGIRNCCVTTKTKKYPKLEFDMRTNLSIIEVIPKACSHAIASINGD